MVVVLGSDSDSGCRVRSESLCTRRLHRMLGARLRYDTVVEKFSFCKLWLDWLPVERRGYSVIKDGNCRRIC
jgi:hypothetical protein